jgi:hypothetical protein
LIFPALDLGHGRTPIYLMMRKAAQQVPEVQEVLAEALAVQFLVDQVEVQEAGKRKLRRRLMNSYPLRHYTQRIRIPVCNP